MAAQRICALCFPSAVGRGPKSSNTYVLENSTCCRLEVDCANVAAWPKHDTINCHCRNYPQFVKQVGPHNAYTWLGPTVGSCPCCLNFLARVPRLSAATKMLNTGNCNFEWHIPNTQTQTVSFQSSGPMLVGHLASKLPGPMLSDSKFGPHGSIANCDSGLGGLNRAQGISAGSSASPSVGLRGLSRANSWAPTASSARLALAAHRASKSGHLPLSQCCALEFRSGPIASQAAKKT